MSNDTEGVLPCGRRFSIHVSRKKSPGLAEGEHYIAVLLKEDGSGDETSIPNLPSITFVELVMKAHEFAIQNGGSGGKYRIAFNGPGVGRRAHAHVHIMLPSGNDALPTLVAQEDKVVG